MLRKWNFTLLFVLVIGAGSAATAAESPSALLEKGIYTEETVGDLPKAIEIYEKVVAEAKAAEAYAAEAQYRLAQCLLKQKKNDEAVAAFRKLIEKYPDQKDWVAKAKKLIPAQAELKLDQAPWKDGQFMQSVVKLGGGMKIGTFVWSVESAKLDGKDIWRMKKHQFILSGGDNRGFTQVDADKTTFRPLKSIFRHTLLGEIEAEYTPSEAIVTVFKDGKKVSSNKVELDKIYYDNEQAYHVFQRLPLIEGYKGMIPIFTSVSANKLELPVEVVGKETVEVPAGKFECYKLHLGIVNQDFWMSTDANHYIVKFEAGGVTSELEQAGQYKPDEMRPYKNEEWGISLSAPAGWFFFNFNQPDKPEDKTVFLLDPEEAGTNFVTLSKIDNEEAKNIQTDAKKALKSWADTAIAEKTKELKDLKVRPDSWQERTVGGLPALSVITDYTYSGNKKVGYAVFIMGKTTKALCLITLCDPDKINSLRTQFDKIVDTLKIK